MAKRVIYTNLIGNYESLQEEFKLNCLDIPLLCFTDDKNLKSEKWNCIYVEPKFPSDPIRSSRYLKINGHELLNEFEEIMWVDNSVQLKPNAFTLFDFYLKNNDLAIPVHSFRENLKDEFMEVLNKGIDDPSILLTQMSKYHNENNEILRSKVYWTGIILKRNNLIIEDTMRLWFNELINYSKRDQLSLSYVLSRVKINFEAIKIDNFESEFHKWPTSLNRKSKYTQENEMRLITYLNMLFDNRLKELDLNLQGIVSSNSWKLTGPLRKLAKIFKSFRIK